MCGIAGFWGHFDQRLLEKMTESISHRGPDDQGTCFLPEQGVGLGHRRLSIIDLSPRGKQPMWDEEKRAAISYNGEIYNFQELKRDLERNGFSFRSTSDTEVLLKLYLHKGVDMLQDLNGIFAFAIWDARKNALFLARDHLGVKPLYLSQTPMGFIFASEIKSLLQCAGLSRELNYDAVAYNLTYLWTPAPHTVLKDVEKLEPGFALWLEKGQLKRKWRYYDLPYGQDMLPYSVDQAALAVAQAVEDAVRRQMVSDVEVGAFLSGGLDSSSVAAMATRHNNQKPLKCFTIGSNTASLKEEGFAEDVPYARKVAQYLGGELHEVMIGPEMFDDLQFMVRHLDEPQADLAPLNVYFISRLAREMGVKVLLSGAGGDDIFTGYRRHLALGWERWWTWLPLTLRVGLQRLTGSMPLGIPQMRRMAKMFQGAHLDQTERIVSYFQWIGKESLAPLFCGDLRPRMQELNLSGPLLHSLDQMPPDLPPTSKMMYLEAKHFLCDHNLAYTDKMSMAVGVETRVPLLDLDLVNLAVRLPWNLKQKNGTGKWIFKKSMEPFLPGDVIYRPKTGFGAPVRSWLQNKENPLVDDLLSPKTIRDRGIFSAEKVSGLKDSFWNHKADTGYTLLALACFELWMREFVDAPPPGA